MLRKLSNSGFAAAFRRVIGIEIASSHYCNHQKRGYILLKKLNFFLVLLISICFLQCSKNPVSTEDEISTELTPAQRTLIQSDNKFGLKLFREIIKEEKDSNVFISPLSVSMALGMTYNGANGETQEAMQEVLELNDLTIQEVNESYKSLIELLRGLDPKVQFQIANSIWYRQNIPVREEFIDLCNKYFDALVSGLDFDDPAAVDTINAWVDENTNGKIEEIVDAPISDFTAMFLINAIYFKGTWTYQFDRASTKDTLFTLPDGTKKPCKMMEQRGLYNYFSNDDFEAVDLPYGDGDFSMTIFLPYRKTNIDSLIAKFNQENLNHWLSSFLSDSGDIYIPKFTLEYELKLNDALKALGMSIAFDPERADFSKMYEIVSVWIDEVKHKTFVEVNEEGTEAAAATAVEMSYGPGPLGFWMRVDRPFVFMIRENKSQTILFIGKIVEPTLE
ncbi:MAG: serpin family protein [candidate division Zixibacteria bacterium]|nr:serpin family protein [candidate division Zixibacteria bacterium]